MGESTAALVYNLYRDLALFELLPQISNTRAEKNTFKFIDSELSHYPWFTGARFLSALKARNAGRTC